MSNSKELQAMINCKEQVMCESTATEESYAQSTLGGSNRLISGVHKVHGIIWDVDTDELVIQELCQSKVDWDEPLPDALSERWKRLLSLLHTDEPLRIPRIYASSMNEPVRLIGFCDASTKAYAATVYLRDVDNNCSLVACKTRVAPLQTQTIPRLELLGALLLARLIVHVKESLSSLISSCDCYTDSSIVLHWIKGVDKSWKPFVMNRVREIRERVGLKHWHHCRSEENPADIPSRGVTLMELKESHLWFYGPEWLRENSSSTAEEGATLPPECLEELRVRDRETVMLSAFERREVRISTIMSIERFSCYEKLIMSTAYVILFIEKLKKRILTKVGDNGRGSDSVSLTVEKFKSMAEVFWIRDTQDGLIKREWKTQFGLFLDDNGIWRCGGRLNNANLSFGTLHPILLPKSLFFYTHRS